MNLEIIYELEELLKQRRKELPKGSYTAEIFQQGMVKILDKLGEEVAELMVAVNCDYDERVVSEAADSYFHLLVALVFIKLEFEELPLQEAEELSRRDACAAAGQELGQSICLIADHESISQQELAQQAARLFGCIGLLVRSRQLELTAVEEELRRRMR